MTNELIKDYTLRITQSSRGELIVVLYDLAIDYINGACSAYNQSNHDDFRKECVRAEKVVLELADALDFNYDLAKPLYRIYEYVANEISMSVIKNDIAGLRLAVKYLTSLKESFAKVAADDTTGPMLDNSQSVYAGLTYGRGVLNENVTADNYNRGYTV